MPQESGPGLPAEIRFAPAIVPLTRATGTAFEEGDAIGIYCVESTDDPAAAIVGERYIDNKQLTMTAGTLTGTTPCFWPTEYTDPSDFYAYFPYNEKGLSGDKQSYRRFPLRSTRATTRLSARAITCSPVPRIQRAPRRRFRSTSSV